MLSTSGSPSSFYTPVVKVWRLVHPNVLIPSVLPSLFLFRLGLAPQIHDLYGKVKFTGKPAPFLCP